MAAYYLTYAVKPTAVTEALTVNLFEADSPCLVLAKSTHLQVFKMGEQGLEPIHDYPVYGKVACIRKMTFPQMKGLDSLLVMTDDMRFFVLTFNEHTKKLETHTNGNLLNPSSFPMETGPLVAVDPDCRVIVMAMYPGLVKILRIHGCKFEEEASEARLDADQVLSMAMLHGCAEPTLAVLCQRADQRFVKLMRVTSRNELVEVSSVWKTRLEGAVPDSAHFLHPVPNTSEGCLVFGADAVVYADANGYKAASIPEMMVQAVADVDDSGARFLIGDSLRGGLALLVLEREEDQVQQIVYEPFGETVAPSTLAYLDNSVVFVGSVVGDSQVVKLETDDDNQNKIIVLDTHENIGSVLDMCSLPQASFGETRLVTASGAGKDGSLRVIQRGVNITSSATVQLDDLQRVWVLTKPSGEAEAATEESFLALSFAGGLAFLQFEGEELCGFEVPSAPSDPALLCSNVAENQWLFVTEDEVVLVCAETLARVAEWKAAEGQAIGACACSEKQLVVSSGRQLLIFEIAKGKLTQTKDTTLEHELSCLDILPVNDDGTSVMVAGTWNVEAKVYHLPSMRVASSAPFKAGVIATSCAITRLGDQNVAFFGMGDGSVVRYIFAEGSWHMTNQRHVHAGKQPVSLVSCKFASGPAVVALSNTSLLFYADSGRVTFSTLNEANLTCVAPLSTPAYPDSLVFSTPASLGIGQIGRMNNLHINKVALGFSPVSLTTISANPSYVVVVGHVDQEDGGIASAIRVFDGTTLEMVASHELPAPEAVNCVIQHKFKDDNTEYFIIGTAFVDPTETQPSRGRILISKLENKKEIAIVHECEAAGSVYCLTKMCGKDTDDLVAGINNQVVHFKYDATGQDAAKKLRAVSGNQNFGAVVSLDSCDDIVLVGDMLNAVFVMQKAQDKLQLVAGSQTANWVSSCALVNETVFLVASHAHSLSVCQREFEPGSTMQTLNAKFEIYLGETVTSFVRAALGSAAAVDSSMPLRNTFFVFGTMGGGLACLLPLTPPQTELLTALECRMEEKIGGLGGLDHREFRTARDEQRMAQQVNPRLVDGDLVETFLQLPEEEQKELVAGMSLMGEDGRPYVVTAEVAKAALEAMARLH
ncbi:hypothetical protein PTSG_00286 [Salpingoeca rosetta]|uniref:DNA damage-binding protein 1 n=1 Tax=Salpingoeca rosetta (strain ATCC 50818 / BSB-021) TaxID=946362 RepID=F2TW20_SALR5|nr:uncharacterized protein PTSG_00286 [Salpingoeca rosetta]EGD72266.1 hypothetical protein PTSG_00286 [Salpingoeca rosetta]|eukprot:XP_004998837.1 hypothetical protein PTSG_00286 [Salpingoeca rosetta]